MTDRVVSAHNPMTGPRHLGHYGSTMRDWRELQETAELIIIIDDLIASVLYPRGRDDLERRSLFIVRDFLASGLDPGRTTIAFTSMIPEAFELTFFASATIDHAYCEQLYRETFPALLNSEQRRELALAKYASLAEVVYPQLGLAALTLGLKATHFQGGEEMLGYRGVLEELAHGLPSSFEAPKFLKGSFPYVRGSDGRHMASENALYLASDSGEISDIVSRIQDAELLRHWCSVAGDEVPEALATSDHLDDRLRQIASDLLIDRLQTIRDFEIAPEEIITIVEDGALRLRLMVKESLAEIKNSFGIPGFNAA